MDAWDVLLGHCTDCHRCQGDGFVVVAKGTEKIRVKCPRCGGGGKEPDSKGK